MNQNAFYPIGTMGQPWSEEDKQAWYQTCQIRRSYLEEVASKIQPLSEQFELIQYGALTYAPEIYPLFALKSNDWDDDKPTILITGGVHGYESSGVHGAITFVQTKASDYEKFFNFIIAPCVSPWGYETINRWNPSAIDPNRSFYHDSPAEESAALMQLVEDIENQHKPILAHIDLHETTDTDELEFRPALAARDGVPYQAGSIPDGFYLVGDTLSPQPEFQRAIIESVAKVTHIAPADGQGQIIGADVTQQGVINYPTKALGLCAGLSHAKYCTTTEVYPDSPQVNADDCNQAQVAAIVGALDYLQAKAQSPS